MSTVEKTVWPLLIDGELQMAADGETFTTFDPSTGEAIGEVARGRAADMDRAVKAARRAFEDEWFDSLPLERSRLLATAGRRILEAADELAELGAQSSGFPLAAVRRDVQAAARYFEYYAGMPDKIAGEVVPLGPDFLDYAVREPWGVCAIIVPFNSPYQLFSRSVAPALAAGNTVVVKAPEQASLGVMRLARLLAEIGLPAGVMNVVPGLADAGPPLVTHPEIDHITFTGSLATGRRVMESAAQNMVPVTMELGGKSPHIVFEDADCAEVAKTIVSSFVWSAGQACSSGTRVLVHKAIHRDLAGAVAEGIGRTSVGRAIDDPDMGPLISERQRDLVLTRIAAGVESGARLIMGGGKPRDADLAGGFFVEPTVFDGVERSSSLAREEIFGPVISLIEFEGEAQAIDLANDSEYGLIAGVWTNDIGRAHRVARKIKAGQIYVNTYGVGAGVEIPFGGYKKSGFGREKGVAGYFEYTQLKNVCVKIVLPKSPAWAPSPE